MNNIIKNEITFEKNLIKQYKSMKRRRKPRTIISQKNHGSFQFLIRNNSKGKRKYIRRGDPLLDECYLVSYLSKAIEVLESNVKVLEEASENFMPYDVESINGLLPKGLRDAYDYITSVPKLEGEIKNDKDGEEVIQSENPAYRNQLKFPVSNGLMVRSKNEVNIAELLLKHKVKFRYEKALTLKRWEKDHYGEWVYSYKTIYPDFTIQLDDKELYWEHEGLMDLLDYAEDNDRKLMLYGSNGILIPDRLIITMDTKEIPFDNMMFEMIIKDFILPRIKRNPIL